MQYILIPVGAADDTETPATFALLPLLKWAGESFRIMQASFLHAKKNCWQQVNQMRTEVISMNVMDGFTSFHRHMPETTPDWFLAAMVKAIQDGFTVVDIPYWVFNSDAFICPPTMFENWNVADNELRPEINPHLGGRGIRDIDDVMPVKDFLVKGMTVNEEGIQVVAEWNGITVTNLKPILWHELTEAYKDAIDWGGGHLIIMGSVNDPPDPLCRCPACGTVGPLMSAFSLLAAGMNGITAGSADDLDMQECGCCAQKLHWN
jgi:hypothetical protein